MTDWQKQRSERSARLNAGSHYASGKMVPPDKAKAFLEAVIRPGDRVYLEGDNQKQAVRPDAEPAATGLSKCRTPVLPQ